MPNKPDEFNGLRNQLIGLAKGLGISQDELARKPEVVASLMVTSKPEVHRFDEKFGGQRSVVLEGNNQVVSF